jgi:hypothetical protein
MSRRVVLLLAAPVLAALTWSMAADKSQPPAAPQLAAAPRPAVSPADRLATRIDFAGFDDPDLKLGEALDKLGRDTGLAFDLNEAAFRAESIDDVLTNAIGAAVPKMKNVTVERVLLKLLARIPAQSGATYLVRRESVEITTGAAQVAEVWSPNRDPNVIDLSPREPRLPLVSVQFDRKPLAEALKELARQGGMNVVVDARVAEKAKFPVTARFRNTPLDTAVTTLADMVDLKPFVVDNLLYVTTRDNADRLDERERPKGMPDDSGPGPRRIGNGPARGRRPSAPDGGMV